jgi:integrase/recombinase XerC/integrase/recombinase XerD
MNQRLSTRSIRKIVKARFRAIHLDTPRLSCHSLRHTCVSIAVQAGAKIQDVQQMARHADIGTTMGYYHSHNRSMGLPEKKIDELLGNSSQMKEF